jgi:dihydroneopterin aldolase
MEITGMDVIRLTGIRAYGYVGAFPEEQVLGQWFEVDVAIWLNLSLPAQSDRLTDTLDYGKIVQGVQSLMKTARFALLERLAAAIAEAILYPTYPVALPVQQVQVCLTKLTPPIPDFSGKVTIELIRQR